MNTPTNAQTIIVGNLQQVILSLLTNLTIYSTQNEQDYV